MKITRRKLRQLLRESSNENTRTASGRPKQEFINNDGSPIFVTSANPNSGGPTLIKTEQMSPRLVEYLADGINDLVGGLANMGNLTEDFTEFVVMPQHEPNKSWENTNVALDVANSPGADISTVGWPGNIQVESSIEGDVDKTTYTITEPAYSVKSTHIGTMASGATFNTTLASVSKLAGHAFDLDKRFLPRM